MRNQTLTSTILSLCCLGLAAGQSVGQTDNTNKSSAAPTVVANELIFPTQSEHVHSSSIVELPDGTLLAAWFQGSGEKNSDDVRIMGARKQVGAAEWGHPFELADTPGHPDCNPVLWIDKDDRLWLFWSAILANDWDSALIRYRISTNYLATDGPPEWNWQDNVHLRPKNFSRHMVSSWRQLVATLFFAPRAVQAEMSSLSLSQFLAKEWDAILIVLVLLAAPWAVHAWRRSRTGRAGWKRFALRGAALYASVLIVGLAATFGTFLFQSRAKFNQRIGWLTANQPVQLENGQIVLPLYSDRYIASMMAITTDGGMSWETSEPLFGFGNIQPSLVLTGSGKLNAWMRESGLRKRIRHSASTDNGRTWSPVVETDLPNPGSKVAVTALKSGEWVIAYNALIDGRHSLSLAISADEGRTWRPFHQLESGTPEVTEFSYPCLIQTVDGRILVTYSTQARRDGKKYKSIRHVALRQPTQGPMVRMADGGQSTRR